MNWDTLTLKDIEEYNKQLGPEFGIIGPKLGDAFRLIASQEGFVAKPLKNKIGKVLGFGNYADDATGAQSAGYRIWHNKGWDKRNITKAEGLALAMAHLKADGLPVDRVEELDASSMAAALDVAWHGGGSRVKDQMFAALSSPDKKVKGFTTRLFDRQFKNNEGIQKRNALRSELVSGATIAELEARHPSSYVDTYTPHKAVKKVAPTRKEYAFPDESEPQSEKEERLKGLRALEDVLAEYDTLIQEEHAKAVAPLPFERSPDVDSKLWFNAPSSLTAP
jgi:hypothetical protein